MKLMNFRRLALATLIVIALTISGSKGFLQPAQARQGASVEKGVGTAYGTRDPGTCTDTKKPLRGAPSAVQAKQYVICSLEHVNGQSLYLAEDVTIVVGGGIPYNPNNFPYATDIDPKSPVYPIRASFNEYQCGRVYKDPSSPLYNVGKNCTEYHIPKSAGVCVKTTFGDWRCDITSRDDDSKPPKRDVPPPQASTIGSGPAVSQRPETTRPANSQAPNTSQYPPLDTTAMETWYTIVKSEYDIIKGQLYVTVKLKEESHPTSFYIKFLDADGVTIKDALLCCPSPAVFSHVGDVEKLHAYTPGETEMEKVKSVILVRNKS